MEKKNHIIDPDKLAKILRVKWEHPNYSEGLQYDKYGRNEYFFPEPNSEPEIDLEAYIFYWPNGVNIYFSNNSPNQLIIRPAFEYLENNTYIKFKNITDVHYFEDNNLVVIESKNKKSFSQIAIFADSEFHIVINEPIANYQKSFAITYKNLLGGGKQDYLVDS